MVSLKLYSIEHLITFATPRPGTADQQPPSTVRPIYLLPLSSLSTHTQRHWRRESNEVTLALDLILTHDKLPDIRPVHPFALEGLTALHSAQHLIFALVQGKKARE